MHNPITVEFRSRTVPADDATIAQRSDVVDRLGYAGHIEPDTGSVNTERTEWCAKIGDTELPLVDFAVQHLDDGRVAFTITAEVEAVSIGNPPDEDPTGDDSGDEKRQLVEERLNFAQQANGHDHTLAVWTCGCDPVLTGIRGAARSTGNISLRTVSLGEQVASNAEATNG